MQCVQRELVYGGRAHCHTPLSYNKGRSGERGGRQLFKGEVSCQKAVGVYGLERRATVPQQDEKFYYR